MIKVQTEDFDVAANYQALQASPEAGAIVFFVGSVRDLNEKEPVSELFLEHYPGMTEQVLENLVGEATQRWNLTEARVIHRVGRLQVNDQIVFVGVSARHRHSAFEAAEYIMDQLKTNAPFWKKETRLGESHWLDQRAGDADAAARWCDED